MWHKYDVLQELQKHTDGIQHHERAIIQIHHLVYIVAVQQLKLLVLE